MAGVAGVPEEAVAVVVGVDGAGRTHRLNEIAAATTGQVLRVNPPVLDVDQLAADLAAVGADDAALVLVDDAHRLSAAETAALAAAARRGVRVVLARRPTLASRDHADLDEAVGGRVEQLAALDLDAVAALVQDRTGRPVSAEEAAALHAASGGLPAVVVALAHARPGQPEPSLMARVQRRLALRDHNVAALAHLLALRLDLPDAVLAAASELDSHPGGLGSAMRQLRDEGMLVPGGESMVPAVAEAVLADLPAAQRRRVHEAVARALVAAGADPVTTATQLRAARAYLPAAADSFAAAGDRVRLEDPAAAMAWYDDAVEAGAEAGTVAVGRAEAAVLLGLPVDAPIGVPPDQADRAAAVAGVVEAHHGRSERAAAALVAAAGLGPLLAVPSLVAIGDLTGAKAGAEAGADAPVSLRRLAEASLVAATDPARSVPLFIEAAEAAQRTPPAVVLPDTAHGLGALLASAAGDTASAEHLLGQVIAAGSAAPVFDARHRLLLAWVRLRAGRYDTAVALLADGADARLAGRERLLYAAISAGVARRSGDVASLREAWQGVEPMLARRAVDLFATEAIEELAVAATRLRQHARVAPVLEALDEIVDRLGHPPAWTVVVGWIRVQAAIAAEDAQAAAAAAQRIAQACAVEAGARQSAQCAAAASWARVLAGDVDPEATVAVASQLAEVDLPWEGSRLVGQAAIRTADAAAARRLLERARELSSAEVTTEQGGAATSYAGLSEREVEVARMVLAGDTYREIGARLFISPKTVEHHVARIRTKVGATSRAELIAALRGVLGALGGG